MEKIYTMCQSCGYPLKKDKKGGGTEKDGSLSKKYCSMCYENGEFLNPPEIDTAVIENKSRGRESKVFRGR
jgi:hypothetical protein